MIADYDSALADFYGDPDREPLAWERQAGESDLHWSWFVTYRDLGPERTQAATAKEVSRSVSAIQKCANANNWPERVRMWDDYVDAERRRISIEERIRSDKEHLEVSRLGFQKVKDALNQIDPGDLKPQYIAPLMSAVSKLQRLALGEATSISEAKGPEPKSLEQLSAELTKKAPSFD